MCNSFNKKFLDEAAKHWTEPESKADETIDGYMKKAIKLAVEGVDHNEGGPFGCIIVKDGKIVGRGKNRVTSSVDPTAHAEVLAIREACSNLGSHQLDGCVMYTSCEPCPMCLGAIYWARPDKVYYAATRKDAANVGFDDAFIYEQIAQPIEERSIEFHQLGRKESLKAFERWNAKEDKIEY